ncbi:DNA polymerase [Acanthamoeba castellanii medusavirus]|uniref:DNA polymerase n=1 Tax=Acanthamoeba castellanii medusavirus J1 TaxID=3114988 RepID=A0A3T1CXK2_9VIRU|nr:DNA polymerase [Acanthamoeba castellanii medusavirus]BBI30551.1 DNA polymerase [Acanthamoeba castellanii medusavirus J1]
MHGKSGGRQQRRNDNYHDADEHMRWPLPDLPTSTAPSAKRARYGDSNRGAGGIDDPFLEFRHSDYTWTPDARWPEPREPWDRSHDPANDDLEIFILKIEQYTQKPTVHKHQWPSELVRGPGKAHTIRIFGLTAEGRTVTLEVHGYCPYLYVYAPPRLLKAPREERGKILDEIQGAFEDAILDSPYRYNDHNKRTPAIAEFGFRPRRALNKFYPPTEKEVAIAKRAFEGKSLPEDALGDDGSKKDVMIMVSTYLEEDLKLLRSAIHGVSLRGKVIDDHELLAGVQRETFDSDIELTMRFESDISLKGCNWLRVPAGSYDLVRNVPTRQFVQSLDTADAKNLAGTGFYRTRTFTQAIANCRWDSIVAINDRDEYPKGMRVMSFDLETKSLNPVDQQCAEPYRLGDIMDENDDNMPVVNDPSDMAGAARIAEAADEIDEETEKRASEINWSAPRDNGAGIIQLSAVLMEYPSHEIVRKALFTLGEVVPKLVGEDVDVFAFGLNPADPDFDNDKEERRMLHAFTRYVALADPDVITGYNTLGFDWNYLIQRYEYLGIPPLLGRTGKPVKVNKNVFQSRSQGTREYMRPEMDGRISLDMRVEVERSGRKLPQYTLKAVSMVYLDDKKEDVHYTNIPVLWRGTRAERSLLGRYCVKDSVLPLLLMKKLNTLTSMMAMSRTTGIDFQALLVRGQSIRVFRQIRDAAIAAMWVMPFFPRDMDIPVDADKRGPKGYKGAIVIDPKKGYYLEWTLVYDFASLYPSIIIAWNLCYTTLVPPAEVEKLRRTHPEWMQEPNERGHVFLHKWVRRGLLPDILARLTRSRGLVKKKMQEAHDAGDYVMESVHNANQNAIKVSSNSVYGFTGATVGKLPCLPVAESVTCYGRDLIVKTRDCIEKAHYDPETGKEIWPGGEVTYGDTDSVMVRMAPKFSQYDVPAMIELAAVGQKLINALFGHLPPLKIEFEKFFKPFIQRGKKKYAGLKITIDATKELGYFISLHVSGLESVRRDSARVVSTTVRRALELALQDGNPEGALKYVIDVVKRLHRREIPIEEFIITRGLTKSDYTTPQAHSELNKRIKRREGSEQAGYTVGDRIPYVMCTLTNGGRGQKSKVSDNAEDPRFAQDNNIPIDIKYYLARMNKPIRKLMDKVFGKGYTANHIFNGPHTQRVVVPTCQGRKNTLGAHFKVIGRTTPGTNVAEATPRAAPVIKPMKWEEGDNRKKRPLSALEQWAMGSERRPPTRAEKGKEKADEMDVVAPSSIDEYMRP